MVFSSLTFLFLFLPITLLFYYIVPGINGKNIILLLASLVFYAWGEPVYVILMILSIIFNFYIANDMSHYTKKSSQKRVLVFGIIVNLLILGYFKYSGLLIDTVNQITGLQIVNRELPLPIGISFYTFQTMSYLIDVYRGDSKPQKKISSFAVYITMFPQLIAGPIVRYIDIDESLNHRHLNPNDFSDGVMIFVKGLAKKVLLANLMGTLHTNIMAMGTGNLSVLSAWLGAIAYALQIFNDFSGYSDMAIGLGKMLGFNFPKNFDRPYSAASITEFWRRWHISLSSWFREYVYIPLGGNRKGAFRQIINLLIVWSLTGLWHGAAWNFVFWGLYYGLLLIFEKYVFVHVQKHLPRFVCIIITFIVVLIGWVFFFSSSLGDAFTYLSSMFGRTGIFVDETFLFQIKDQILIIILAFIPAMVKPINFRKMAPALKWSLCILFFILSVAFLISDSYNPFLYFRF